MNLITPEISLKAIPFVCGRQIREIVIFIEIGCQGNDRKFSISAKCLIVSSIAVDSQLIHQFVVIVTGQ